MQRWSAIIRLDYARRSHTAANTRAMSSLRELTKLVIVVKCGAAIPAQGDKGHLQSAQERSSLLHKWLSAWPWIHIRKTRRFVSRWRQRLRAKHIHCRLSCAGNQPLVTQLYFEGDPWNVRGPLVRRALVMLVRRTDGRGARVTFDLVLQPSRA
jgi:hypothetical protein